MRVLQNKSDTVSSSPRGSESTPRSSGTEVAPGAQKAALVITDNQRQPVLDYLCVCGLSKPSESLIPVLLTHAPLSVVPERQLAAFCFPDQPPQYRPAAQNLHILESPVEEVRTSANMFMFCLNANAEAPVYAFVMRTWEVLEEPPPWMPEKSVEPTSLLAQRHLTQRAYCIVSRNPYARLLWDLLFYLVKFERDRLSVTDADKRRRAIARQNQILRFIEALARKRAVPGKEVELTMPSFPGGKLSFQMPDATHSLRVSVAAVCLPALLRAFTPDDLVVLLCALMIESKVVFVGSSAGRVSACVMALTAAIAPFSWQAALMPLVPPHVSDMFDAPVPYVCGRVAHQLRLDNWSGRLDYMPPGSSLVIAAVDTGVVHVLGAALPALPEQERLAETLRDSHMWLRSSRRVMSRMCEDDYPYQALNERDARQLEEAIDSLNQYTVWLLDSIRRLLPGHAYSYQPVTSERSDVLHSPENPEVCAELLKQMLPEHHEFMDALFNSQHYHAIATTFGDIPAPTAETEGTYAGCVL